eukprot:Trichotokara_eunicae@DN2114_c0_g1_i2.p1
MMVRPFFFSTSSKRKKNLQKLNVGCTVLAAAAAPLESVHSPSSSLTSDENSVVSSVPSSLVGAKGGIQFGMPFRLLEEIHPRFKSQVMIFLQTLFGPKLESKTSTAFEELLVRILLRNQFLLMSEALLQKVSEVCIAIETVLLPHGVLMSERHDCMASRELSSCSLILLLLCECSACAKTGDYFKLASRWLLKSANAIEFDRNVTWHFPPGPSQEYLWHLRIAGERPEFE